MVAAAKMGNYTAIGVLFRFCLCVCVSASCFVVVFFPEQHFSENSLSGALAVSVDGLSVLESCNGCCYLLSLFFFF